MAWSFSNSFGPWGDSGEKPPDNKDYQGGDLVNEKHFDWLWNTLKGHFDSIEDALSQIDSDGDGVVDDSDQLNGQTPSYYLVDVDDSGSVVKDDARTLNFTTNVDVTNPSGDQVDVAVPSTVTGELPSDETSNRSVNTWYQNTTGTALVVYINNDGSSGVVPIHMNTSQSDNKIGDIAANTLGTFIVGTQNYYKVGDGSDYVYAWHEQEL